VVDEPGRIVDRKHVSLLMMTLRMDGWVGVSMLVDEGKDVCHFNGTTTTKKPRNNFGM
jgi:hypothetical protein